MWVKLDWITRDLAGDQDEIEVVGVRSFRVVEKVTESAKRGSL
jgi:hypothetical protein